MSTRTAWLGRNRGAFTLMELLVAMSITILLVALLMKVFAATSNTWQHGEAQVDAYREARGALQIIARDLSATLQASYLDPNTNGGVSASGPLLPTLVLERYPNTTVDPASPKNEEVYCLTNISNSGASSLCAVGYYCQWMPDLASGNQKARAPRAYALMRQFLDSNGTFKRIQANAPAATPTPTPSASPTPTPAPLLPLKFLDLYARTGAPAPKVDQLAAYIWDLRFRIDTDLSETKDPDGNEPGVAVDHSSPQRRYDGDPNTKYPPSLPAYVEVRFKALSTTAGRRLENQRVTQADWQDSDPDKLTATYRNLIRPNAQQFVLRVPLAHNPLDATNNSPSPTP